MNIIEIITKKLHKQELSEEELEYVIKNYLDKKIVECQMSSLLMAICINGMSDEEIFNLTDIMLNSGDQINLDGIEGIKVDKHSTGGIGDKTTLILAPLVASTGVYVVKMSGRGLGYTGGTADKLESIPGFKIHLDINELITQVSEINQVIASQTGNLVPADKALYALRDITGTVESIPLIASSIMSKKLASGVDKIVMDVKVGKGALIKTLEDAAILSKIMVKIGKKYNKETVCVITNMDEPLGNAVGNSLEVREAIEVLKGRGPKDVQLLVLTLASYMVSLGKNISYSDANREVVENLKNGKAYEKFEELVLKQHGNLEEIEYSSKVYSLKSKETGFVKRIDAEKIGELVRNLGGGRYHKSDNIDYKVGIVLNKKVGDYVLEDEELVKVYLGEKDININDVLDCFEIGMKVEEKIPLIYGVIK